ncbi:MAG: DUF5324 family protein, partial [Sporichthyaceae bacterium]
MSRSTTDLKKLRKESRKSARRAGKKMSPVASDARDSAVRYAESTRDWAAPKVEAARDWAAPRVEPVATRVKEDVLPRVAEAVTAALAASEPAREEAKSRGTAAIAALRGEVEAPKPKKHRVRKMFLLAGVVGAAVAGWKAWVGSSNKPDPWATPIGTASSAGAGTGGSAGSSSTSRTTGGTGTTMAPVTDDAAGASPDEALADKAEEGAAKTSPSTPSAAAGSRASTTSTTEKVPPK